MNSITNTVLQLTLGSDHDTTLHKKISEQLWKEVCVYIPSLWYNQVQTVSHLFEFISKDYLSRK